MAVSATIAVSANPNIATRAARIFGKSTMSRRGTVGRPAPAGMVEPISLSAYPFCQGDRAETR
jgi:hypothetical protein